MRERVRPMALLPPVVAMDFVGIGIPERPLRGERTNFGEQIVADVLIVSPIPDCFLNIEAAAPPLRPAMFAQPVEDDLVGLGPEGIIPARGFVTGEELGHHDVAGRLSAATTATRSNATTTTVKTFPVTEATCSDARVCSKAANSTLATMAAGRRTRCAASPKMM